MRFHYVPSTYRGRKFGKGYYGGSYMGYGRICGGSLADLGFTQGKINTLVNAPVNVPVSQEEVLNNIVASAPPKLTPELIERAKKIIAYAEATGKAQPITKKEAGFWSGLKNIGSKAWNATKAVGKTALKGAWTATKYGVPLALKVAPIALSAAAFASTNPLGKAALDYISPSIIPTIKKIIPKEFETEIKNHNRDLAFKKYPLYRQMKRFASHPVVQTGMNYIAPKLNPKIIQYIPGPIGDVLEAYKKMDDESKETLAKEKKLKEEKERREEQEKFLAEQANGPFYGPTNSPEEIEQYYSENPEGKSYMDDQADMEDNSPVAKYERELKEKGMTNEKLQEFYSKMFENMAGPNEEEKKLEKEGYSPEEIEMIRDGRIKPKRDDSGFSLGNAGRWAWKGIKSLFGRGYRRRRRGRFKKGSILARTYMAYLRALRGLKKRSRRGGMLPKALWGSVPNFRGSGCSGGMFRGVSVKDLQKYYDTVKANIIPGSRKITIEWKDAGGNKKTTTTTKQKLHNMLIGTERMKNYFRTWERNEKGKLRKLKNERSLEEQKKLRAEAAINHNRMKTRWPYKKMTQKRLKEILRTFKSMEFQKLKDYWRPRLVASKNRKFYNRWFSYNYFNKDDPKNERAGYFPKKGNSRNVRDLISVVRLNRYKKEGKYKSELIPDDVNDLVIRLSENAIVGFKKDPSVGSPK